MKTLVAITSCARDVANGVNQAVRETWAAKLRAFSIDYKFFIGVGREKEYDSRFMVDYESHKRNRPADAATPSLDRALLKGDEVLVDCPDSWLFLAFKIQESRKWAVHQGYDFIFKIDVDCLLDPSKLVASDYQSHDYWGSRGDSTGPLVYAGGWMGYCLSQKAAILTINAPVTRVTEDCWTGEVMKKHGIRLETWAKPVTVFLGLGHARYTAESIRNGIKNISIPAKPVRSHPSGRPISKTQKRVYRGFGRRFTR